MDQRRRATALLLAPTLACASPGHACGALGAVPPADAANERCDPAEPLAGGLFGRTELVFGTSRAGGPIVTHRQWQAFVDSQIAPRFPRGLTVLMGQGRFRGTDDIAVREDAFVVILLYPLNMKDSSRKIDEIRAAYKRAFRQESVLRIDSQSVVSF